MVIKWHEQGYTVREIAKLMPQVNPEEIKVVVAQHEEDKNDQESH